MHNLLPRTPKKLLHSGAGVISVRLINTLLAFLISIILARKLGPDGFGLFMFVLSALILLSIPLMSGIPTLSVRESAKALLNNDWHLIKKLWYWGIKLSLAYMAFLALLLLAFDASYSDPESSRYHLFLIGFVFVLFTPLAAIQGAILRGIGHIVIGSTFDGLIRHIVIICVLTLVLVLFPSYTVLPSTVVLTYVFASLFSLLLGLFIVSKLLQPKTHATIQQSNSHSHNWAAPLLSLSIIGGIQLVLSYADTVILGLFEDDEKIGIYRIAVQISTLVIFGLTALNQMLHPHFTQLYIKKDMEGLQRLVSFSSRIIFLLAIIPGSIFFIFGDKIITLIYGHDFSSGALALNILIIGALLNAAFGSVGALLNMTGYEKDTMKGMAIALIVNIVLNFMLIPIWGIEGAAIATSLSMIIWNAILWYYVKIRLNIQSIGFLPAPNNMNK